MATPTCAVIELTNEIAVVRLMSTKSSVFRLLKQLLFHLEMLDALLSQRRLALRDNRGPRAAIEVYIKIVLCVERGTQKAARPWVGSGTGLGRVGRWHR
jgi:hypothetical protein